LSTVTRSDYRDHGWQVFTKCGLKYSNISRAITARLSAKLLPLKFVMDHRKSKRVLLGKQVSCMLTVNNLKTPNVLVEKGSKSTLVKHDTEKVASSKKATMIESRHHLWERDRWSTLGNEWNDRGTSVTSDDWTTHLTHIQTLHNNPPANQ